MRTTACQEPYFVVDTHHLQEAGTLQIANYSVAGMPKAGSNYIGSELELEYRLRPGWASELDLHYQTTFGDGTLVTGYSWSNRFKLLPGVHWVNPLLLISWEDTNGADKSIAEIEGRGADADFSNSNALASRTQEHEIETKFILSRDQKGWNFAGNIMSAKDLSGKPWQFGYALAVSRPLSAKVSETKCNFCRRNFTAGLEVYGGMGDTDQFGFRDTAQYVAPEFSWELRNGVAFKASANFGVTRESQHAMIDFAVEYSIPRFGHHFRHFFSGHREDSTSWRDAQFARN